jgi:hypothetical protein
MTYCRLCGPRVPATQMRTIYSGTSDGVYVSYRSGLGVSSRNYYSSKPVCDACAARIDKACNFGINFCAIVGGIVLVIWLIVVGGGVLMDHYWRDTAGGSYPTKEWLARHGWPADYRWQQK